MLMLLVSFESTTKKHYANNIDKEKMLRSIKKLRESEESMINLDDDPEPIDILSVFSNMLKDEDHDYFLQFITHLLEDEDENQKRKEQRFPRPISP